MNTEKILQYISFAARSRSIAAGSDQVLRCVRRGGTICAVLADDASERTAKQISDKCTYYNVPLVRLPIGMEVLAGRCGKISPTAVICVTDPSLAKEIVKHVGE